MERKIGFGGFGNRGRGREGRREVGDGEGREERGEEIVDMMSVRDKINKWQYRRSCIKVSKDIPAGRKKRQEALCGLPKL